MRSVRLDKELDRQLAEAAKACGEPVSNFIRDAVRRRCEEVLENRLDHRLADVIGGITGSKPANVSRATGREFTKLLQRKRKTRK